MERNFAARVERVEPSATLAISTKASELEAEGADVVDLSVGEPDFDTPANIVEAGKAALDAGHTGYTASQGIPALREAIADRLADDGFTYDPDQIMVTPGGKQALFEVVHTLIDDGDEVVLLDPAWVSYEAVVKIAGGSLTRVDLAKHDFALEPALDELAEAVSDDTEMLIVNSPANPSGAVFSEAALEGVRDLAVEHDITVLSDEIYDRVVYDVEPTRLGTLSGMADRTITLNGFSKTYAMTGWRLGYFAAPQPIIDQAGKLQSHSVSCAANFVQRAGIEALENTDTTVDTMVDAFKERRDLLVDLLAERGIDVDAPEGAFYLMLPVSDDDQTWCERAIETAHVATVPGSAFGTPGYARISYANSQERIQEAIERLDAEDLL
ncbi:MAG: pyridoxal phosphate-dependent aminotransferase [Salinarchaeum sp.]